MNERPETGTPPYLTASAVGLLAPISGLKMGSRSGKLFKRAAPHKERGVAHKTADATWFIRGSPATEARQSVLAPDRPFFLSRAPTCRKGR